ncbi:MAG: PHP domain-containing protein [Micromonosporaceae bacterium]|nr:PHP domain-containing protein [Micromonosporaceae bacterium]
MRIDLHTHSTASDGTSTPAELVCAAAQAGLDVVALTDHDTVAGWEPAAAALPPGVRLLPGVELSCRWHGAEAAGQGGLGRGGPEAAGQGGLGRGASAPRGISLHLLGYLFDPAHPGLAAGMTRVRESRERRAERMIELLRADGVDVSWPEVRAYANGAAVGRPHIAQALVRLGLVGSVSDAFESEWLGERYRVAKDDVDVFEGLRLLREAGGVAVFAHPRANRRGRTVPDELIVELAAAGLFGLEADHPDHNPAEREQVRRLAEDLGLAVTGSSDFHGANKTVRLGANTTSPDVCERVVAAGRTAPITAS